MKVHRLMGYVGVWPVVICGTQGDLSTTDNPKRVTCLRCLKMRKTK